jgi:phage terminase large subunit-like protein
MNDCELTDIPREVLEDAELQRLMRLRSHPLATFTPRPDDPANFDEQSAFVNSRAKVACVRGGNGSGKTTCAAYRVAKFLLQGQRPPRKDAPFWIISDSLWQVSEICWKQGLMRFIPHDMIAWDRIQWQSAKLNWPAVIPLKPWPGTDCNWMVELRSAESDRAKFQGVSLGGAWFSEQFPWDIFEEVMRGLRDTYYDGAVTIECTPIDPDLSMELEALEENPPEGWEFFRMNTEANTAVSEEWKRSFFASVSEEMKDTRRTGAYASYRGAIFQAWNPRVHLAGDDVICHPHGVKYRRGIDWGGSFEHPFACVWGYRDGSGTWYIFDEFLDPECMDYPVRAAVIQDRFPWKGTHGNFGTTHADPSRPMMLSMFNQLGIQTSPAVNRVHESIEYIRRLLKVNKVTGQPSIFIHRDRCPELARQMRTYRWLRSSGKGLNPRAPRPEPLKRNDDLVDALRYMIYSEASRHSETGPEVDTERRRRFAFYGAEVIPGRHPGNCYGQGADPHPWTKLHLN